MSVVKRTERSVKPSRQGERRKLGIFIVSVWGGWRQRQKRCRLSWIGNLLGSKLNQCNKKWSLCLKTNEMKNIGIIFANYFLFRIWHVFQSFVQGLSMFSASSHPSWYFGNFKSLTKFDNFNQFFRRAIRILIQSWVSKNIIVL